MRKPLTLLLLLSVGFFTAKAQQKNTFEYGFNAGLNLSTVQAGSTTNSSYRNGFNIAAFGDYYLSDRWSIKARLAYDQKGWDRGYLTDLTTGRSAITDYHLDYLTIPVLANWHFGKKRNWYLNFGPYAGFLLSAKETKFNNDLKDFLHTTDIGFDLGIGVKIPVSSRVKILFEFDGQAGFTDVFKQNDDSRVTTSRSSFNTGLVFSLK